MSVTREEDRRKNTCTNRGLGIAAAAIGVGVGAALYYFFNKREEHPNTEGSTSNWNCESPQTFNISESSDSYTTVSEHETTDTSIYDVYYLEVSFNSSSPDLDSSQSDSDSSELSSSSDSTATSDSESELNDFDVADSESEMNDFYVADSESELNDFDVTNSSLGVPENRGSSRSRLTSFFGNVNWPWARRVSPRRTDEEHNAIREQRFRERSWSLEECSICFDVMLRNQEVTKLPCAHNFHTECIMPWLQEQQTCPNCRKVAQ